MVYDGASIVGTRILGNGQFETVMLTPEQFNNDAEQEVG